MRRPESFSAARAATTYRTIPLSDYRLSFARHGSAKCCSVRDQRLDDVLFLRLHQMDHASRTVAAYLSQNVSAELAGGPERNGILVAHESCDSLRTIRKSETVYRGNVVPNIGNPLCDSASVAWLKTSGTPPNLAEAAICEADSVSLYELCRRVWWACIILVAPLLFSRQRIG